MKPEMISRSRHETLTWCAMKEFISYRANGTGIQRRRVNAELALGSLVHATLAAVLKGGSFCHAFEQARAFYRDEIEASGFDAADIDLAEQEALAEALCRVWCKFRLPSIRQHYDVLAVEKEHLSHWTPSIDWIWKPDAELRRKADGAIMPLEFKTVSYPTEEYFEGWQYSAQTLALTLCMEEEYEEPCSCIKMEFLVKGSRRFDNALERRVYYSPLTRARKVGDNYEWDSGSRRGTPVEVFREMSMATWLEEWLPDDVQQRQVISRDIFRERELLLRWKQTVIQRQEAAAEACPLGILNERCRFDTYNKPCAFLPLCWEGLSVEEALASGEFVPRVPHYELEKEALA